MTPDAWVHAWFEEVWNNGNENAIDQMMSAECLAHGLGSAGGPPIKGPEMYKPFFRSFRSAFPDIKVEILRVITEGNLACAHCRVTASHQGHGLGIAPTGQRVEFSGMTIVRVEEGQVREAWNSFDFMSMFQQVGMLPQLPS